MKHSRKRTILALIPLACYGLLAQTPAKKGATVITSPRPLANAADILQQLYGKVVTYEDPIRVWRGDVTGDYNAKWGLFPVHRTFIMPSGTGTDPDLAEIVSAAMAAYHQQTSGTRFKVFKSKLGFHIIPAQRHNENGAWESTGSLLDSVVNVPVDDRTPMAHLQALVDATSAVTGITLDNDWAGDPDAINRTFRARPAIFPWGADHMVARDALIDLLARSATTFSWSLRCQSSGRAEDRMCALNLSELRVQVTDAQGKPTLVPLIFDRCGDCPRPLPLPPMPAVPPVKQ